MLNRSFQPRRVTNTCDNRSLNAAKHASETKSFRHIYTELHDTLVAAQGERDQRPNLVTVNGQTDWEWAMYERSVMLSMVNRWRSLTGREHIEMAAVEQADRRAGGHFDYTRTFALSCVGLVFTDRDTTSLSTRPVNQGTRLT